MESRLMSSFLQSQQKLFSEATREIENEILKHRQKVALNEIVPLVENITKTKINLLKNEMNANVAVFKSNLEMDLQIARKLESKEKLTIKS